MDPWNCEKFEKTGVSIMNFEDDFHPCFRLPDSEEYLLKLETKLANLKEKRTKKDLVSSLEEKHKSCMEQLLSGVNEDFVSRSDDTLLDSSYSPNVILRRITPEQPVNIGEQIKLLDADHLATTLVSNTPEENETKNTTLDLNSDTLDHDL